MGTPVAATRGAPVSQKRINRTTGARGRMPRAEPPSSDDHPSPAAGSAEIAAAVARTAPAILGLLRDNVPYS